MEVFKERTLSWIDKSAWGEGPWQFEPDKISWVDPATNFPCLIVRGSLLGALCGYVGIPPEHPWFGKNYWESISGIEGRDDSPEYLLNAHRGINFSRPCQEDNKERGVCHLPESDESDHVWWYGFDCAHAGDIWPAMNDVDAFPNVGSQESYKDVDYIRQQVRLLATQLSVIGRWQLAIGDLRLEEQIPTLLRKIRSFVFSYELYPRK